MMTITDAVIEKIRLLPLDEQRQVLDFIQSLGTSTNGSAVKQESSETNIWRELSILGRELESLPTDLPDDLAKNHDHYLHGASKRS